MNPAEREKMSREEIVFRNIANGNLQGSGFTFECPLEGLPLIPRGANPRNPATNNLTRAMIETLKTDGKKFSNRNRGISLVVHNYRWEQSWNRNSNGNQLWDLHVDVSGAGTDTGIGHWDGGHTQLACDLFMTETNGEPTEAVIKINLTLRSRYTDVSEIRECANQQNKLQRQQAWSEANLRGAFDSIKTRMRRHFPNATVEYEQNEHPEGEADYIVMSVLKLFFALVESGENYYLGYGSRGKDPIHSPIAHAMAPGDITEKFEKHKEKYEALPLEVWADFADHVRQDIDRTHPRTKLKERLMDPETHVVGSKNSTFITSHYAKMIVHNGNTKRINSLFNGTKLELNAVDMNCIYPIIHGFAMRFMSCDPQQGVTWRDGKGQSIENPDDNAILDMLKRAWGKVGKEVLQTMVTDFNTNFPLIENSTNGFWPKTSSYFTSIKKLITKTRKLAPIAIDRRTNSWAPSPREACEVVARINAALDGQVAEW